MKRKTVVYTAIFGKYDELPANLFTCDDVDYICFSDHEFDSDLWKVILVDPIYNDSTRNSRKYKALPHRYLADYDYSIWVDGNMCMISDYRELINGSLFRTYDHMQCFDKRNCIYHEADMILQLGQENMKKSPDRGILNWKDNPYIIQEQMDKYLAIGYPYDNGLAETSVVIRMHNDPQCVKLNEDWWTEMKYGSKRDQLSLNFVAWHNDIDIDYLPGDVRNNRYFQMISGHKGKR
jgi:hypothetical protein